MIVCISMFQGKFGRVDPGGKRFYTLDNNSDDLRMTTLHSVALAFVAKIRMQKRLQKRLSMTQGRLAEQEGKKDNIFLKETTINELLQKCKPLPSQKLRIPDAQSPPPNHFLNPATWTAPKGSQSFGRQN